jgi:hypothetical protein
MARIEWPTLARTLAWTMSVAFVVASILLLTSALELFGGPPEPGADFLDNVLADFAWQQTQWPIELAGTALFAIGFLALAGLGPVLGRLAGTADARRGLVLAAFLGAGGLPRSSCGSGQSPLQRARNTANAGSSPKS